MIAANHWQNAQYCEHWSHGGTCKRCRLNAPDDPKPYKQDFQTSIWLISDMFTPGISGEHSHKLSARRHASQWLWGRCHRRNGATVAAIAEWPKKPHAAHPSWMFPALIHLGCCSCRFYTKIESFAHRRCPKGSWSPSVGSRRRCCRRHRRRGRCCCCCCCRCGFFWSISWWWCAPAEKACCCKNQNVPVKALCLPIANAFGQYKYGCFWSVRSETP